MEKSLQDGLYQVEVGLWHAYEEKESMGNTGLVSTAEIFVENNKMHAYLGMKTLTVGDITTSLTRLFYADEASKSYRSADTYLFDIEIPNETKKRPRVFGIPLEEQKEFYNLLVDPKVAVMGTDPIKARLKIDWTTLEPIDIEKSNIYSKIDKDQAAQEKQKEILIQNIRIIDEQGIDGEINVALLTRSNLQSQGLTIEALDQVKGFEITSLEKIQEIPFDQTTDVDKQAKEVALHDGASILFQGEKSATDLYYKKDGDFEKIDFESTEQGLLVKNARYGTYALVKKNNVQPKPEAEATSEKPLPTASKPKPKPISSVVRPVPKQQDSPKIKEKNDIRQDQNAGTVETVNPSMQEPSSNKTENTIGAIQTKEHTGIIVAISLLYLCFLAGGVYLWKRFLPHLFDELDRSKYLEFYALKGDKVENG
ncbi:MAG: NEAT domain-containing protein [Peptostreptococcaceae bacterium]|nr:NEAT domain-containing protein [Peptostreptococcaceae bacterium]